MSTEKAKINNVYMPDHSGHSFHNQSNFQHNYLKSYLHQQEQKQQEWIKLYQMLQQSAESYQHFQQNKLAELSNQLIAQKTEATKALQKVDSLEVDQKHLIKEVQQIEETTLETSQVVKEEALRNTAILDQLTNHESGISSITAAIDNIQQASLSIQEERKRTDQVYAEIAEKLQLQEVFHQSVLEQIEETNGNVNKLSRQLDHLKEIIFERIHYLSDRIENQFKAIVMPVRNFFIPSEEKEKKN